MFCYQPCNVYKKMTIDQVVFTKEQGSQGIEGTFLPAERSQSIKFTSPFANQLVVFNRHQQPIKDMFFPLKNVKPGTRRAMSGSATILEPFAASPIFWEGTTRHSRWVFSKIFSNFCDVFITSQSSELSCYATLPLLRFPTESASSVEPRLGFTW